ncbi:MAG TPA: NAD(P)H-binding protein, partial [Solirubrobacteraceae bacterium]|nr:NAD(P)H-binding protein [Solirubrobacteraceae bacterium]
MTTHGPVLVIGATGKTGRRVARRLRALEIPVRDGSRAADPPFDWEDRSTWGPALRGTSAAYVAFYPDLAVPGAPEAIEALAGEALAAGCRRLVLLSGRGEVEAERAERKLAASGADWTVLRCSWFMQNFSDGDFADMVLAGELALPAADRRAPFVDADDVADAAVAALTEPGHAGRVYELTGPRALSHADVAVELSAATGRSIAYVPISMEAFTDALER